jgi:hypothetical protein
MTRRFHPFSSSIATAFRNWTDTNGNYIPDCNLADFTAQNLSASGGDVCGAISNGNFGKFLPQSTLFDDNVIKDNRDFLWDINAEVDHEVMRGLSVSAAYNHNWDGNFIVTDNLLVGPENFDEFCITVPNDPRLPSAGQEQCGYYDVNPTYFGQGTLKVTNAKGFGKQQRYWDGFTFTSEGRLPRGIRVGGGIDFGRQVDDHCYTVDVPNQPADINNVPFSGAATGATGAFLSPFCKVVTSWANLADFRLRGSVPLKYGINIGAIYRNTPGANEDATLALSTAAGQVRFKNAARTTLTTAKTVLLFAPNSRFGARFSQFDLSINKTFDIGWGRLRAALDVYNALNSNSIQSELIAYSASGPRRWLRPTGFLDPRLARVTATIQF